MEQEVHFKDPETKHNYIQRLQYLGEQLKKENLQALLRGYKTEIAKIQIPAKSKDITNDFRNKVNAIYKHFNDEYKKYKENPSEYVYTPMEESPKSKPVASDDDANTNDSSNTSGDDDAVGEGPSAEDVAKLAGKQAAVFDAVLVTLLKLMRDKDAKLGEIAQQEVDEAETRMRNILEERENLIRQLEDARRSVTKASEHAEELSQLQLQIEDLQRKLQEYTTIHAQNQREVAELHTNMENAKRNADEERDKLKKELERANERAKHEEHMCKVTTESLTKELQEAREQIAEEKRQSAQTIRIKTEELEQARTTAANAMTELESTRKLFREREETFKSTLGEDELKVKNATLEEQVTQNLERIAQLNQEKEENVAEAERQKKRAKELEDEKTLLDTTRERTDLEIQSLREQLKQLKQEMDGAAKRFEEELEQLRTEAAQAEETRTQLTAKAAAESRAAEQALMVRGQLQKELEELRVELEKKATEAKSSSNQVAADDETLQDLRQKNNRLESELEEAKAALAIATETAAVKTEPVSTTDETLQDLTGELTSATKALKEMTGRVADQELDRLRQFEGRTAALAQVSLIDGVLRMDNTKSDLGSLVRKNELGQYYLLSVPLMVVVNQRLLGTRRDADTTVEEDEDTTTTISTITALGAPLTLAGSILKSQYELLSRGNDGTGTRTVRLTFLDSTQSRRTLALRVDALTPQLLRTNAAPELVADLSTDGGAVQYDYVSPLGRELIPAHGVLELQRYNDGRHHRTLKEEYKLRAPSLEWPYGTESMAKFSDGTELYVTYVTPSLYALKLIVFNE